MKISEFEDKLSSVPDAKLRQMLSASRESGPEVAVKLILNECKRRGMDDLDAPAEGALNYAGADAPSDSQKQGTREDAAEADGLDSGAPATAPEWLNEETHSGMPVAVKVLMVILALGAILGLAWKFTR